MMEERNVKKYAFYQIGDEEHYQFLPTSRIEDVIYEVGMKQVYEKSYIEDGGYLIELPSKNRAIGVGEAVTSREIVRRYYEGDSILQHYDKETIDYLKENPNSKWNLDGTGEATLGQYSSYVKVNYGTPQTTTIPHDRILGNVCWYIELHQEDGTVRYEKTFCNDKKYRGQVCQYYEFVQVVEYEIENTFRQAIIQRENQKYPYTPVKRDPLDDIIDQAKELISHQKSFSGFKQSPLYSFNTEDSACVFSEKKTIIENHTVVSVTGSGDANLDLFLNGASKIIAFDANVFTIFYGELKFIAAKYLTFQEFCFFFSHLDEQTYRTLEPYLTKRTRKFWNELYDYSKIVDLPIKDSANGGLFYPTASLFTSNDTIYNKKGYYNEENYAKLQDILQSKTIEDIHFVICDLLELPKIEQLGNCSYAYLSNILDFIVDISDFTIDKKKLEAFKDFVLKDLYPALKENATIDLSYIKGSWHNGIEREYFEVYPENEGFQIRMLSNGRDSVLSFNSVVLKKEGVSQKS